MTTLSSIYQEIKLAHEQKNWSKIRVLSQNDIIRNPTRPNLDILHIILKSLAKSSTKTKKLPPGYIKPSTFTLQQQSTDVLLLMAENMKIEDVLSLCETNKAFNKGICKNNKFWIQRLERDFGSIKEKREGKRNYFQEYVIKYKLRKQKILSEYKEYPELEGRINKWLKDTSKILNISGFGLKEWPEALKGKEHLIVQLNCSNNQLTSIPELSNCMYLRCGDNRLATLTRSGSATLTRSGSTSLPELPKCVELWCNDNQLTSLPELPKCVVLICSFNELTSLPVLAKCVRLNCAGNQLTSLPKLPKCVTLYCNENRLTSIPALPNCVTLYCQYNRLTSIPALPNCVTLYCQYNQLTSIPALPKCVELHCNHNQLTFLQELPKCMTLWCSNNQLTFLPELPSIVSPDQLDARNNPFPPNYTHRLL